MKFSNLFRHRKPTSTSLGIDFASSSIKILELKRYPCLQPMKYRTINLPKSAMAGKTIVDKEAISVALQQALHDMKIERASAVIAVPNAAVMSKIIQLDNSLSQSEMEEHIILEAERYLNHSLAEICLDFQILGPAKDNSRLMNVQLVAAWRREVDLRVEIVKKAGMEVKAVDLESHALARGFNLLKISSAMIVNFDGESVLLLVLHQGNLNYIHFENCVNPHDQAQHINRQMQLYVASGNPVPENIFLVGEVANAPDLMVQIKKQININAQLMNPFVTEQLSSKFSDVELQQGEKWMMSVGLASWHLL